MEAPYHLLSENRGDNHSPAVHRDTLQDGQAVPVPVVLGNGVLEAVLLPTVGDGIDQVRLLLVFDNLTLDILKRDCSEHCVLVESGNNTMDFQAIIHLSTTVALYMSLLKIDHFFPNHCLNSKSKNIFRKPVKFA